MTGIEKKLVAKGRDEYEREVLEFVRNVLMYPNPEFVNKVVHVDRGLMVSQGKPSFLVMTKDGMYLLSVSKLSSATVETMRKGQGGVQGQVMGGVEDV